MGLSLYIRLSQLVTVRDLQAPLLPPFQATMTVEQALAAVARDLLDQTATALVLRDNDVCGWIDYHELRDNTYDDDCTVVTVADQMNPINPNELIAADTTAWRAVEVLGKDEMTRFFVVDGAEITGTITYQWELFKPMFRVCLLGLAIELEQAALQLCSRDRERSMSCLSQGRIDKAKDAWRNRNKHRKDDPGLWTLLESTTLIDKKTMLVKGNLVPAFSREEIEKVFDQFEGIRNACAHPETCDDAPIEPKVLLEALRLCHKLLYRLHAALEPDDREGAFDLDDQ